DGGMQAARQAAAIERDADAFDAGVGAQPNRHDGPLAAGFLRHVGQGIVLGDEQSGDFIALDLHGATSPRNAVTRETSVIPSEARDLSRPGGWRSSRSSRYPLRR